MALRLTYKQKREKARKYEKEYLKRNREKISARRKELYHLNKDRLKEVRKAWYDKRKDSPEFKARQAAKQREWLYGIKQEAYDNMVEEARGKCMICQKEAPLNVDHDHNTNMIRGLLCIDCNLGLGRFRDNETYLENAVRYLVRSRQ